MNNDIIDEPVVPEISSTTILRLIQQEVIKLIVFLMLEILGYRTSHCSWATNTSKSNSKGW